MRGLPILVGALFVFGCAVKPPDGWTEFVAKDAGFSVKLPCAPGREVEEYPYKAGKRYGYKYSCDSNGIGYRITFGDHNPDTGESVQKFLEYSEGDLELAFKDSIKEKQEVQVDGFHGRMYLLHIDERKYLWTAIVSNNKGVLHVTLVPLSTPGAEKGSETFERVLSSVRFPSQ
ncbi:MAG TPA: hypothetical protein PKC65_13655 [Pyrinomonadaceae bacterium]|nr:hypothetical protein [Pyrinomonadaceae bacterium]